jgi:hypothetical protein
MGKKCIPGVFCIENMTLFVLMVALILLGYFYYIQVVKISNSQKETSNTPNIIVLTQPSASISPLASISTRNDPFNDPYSPPMKNDGIYFPRKFGGDVRGGIPINVETRGTSMEYQQVGILTRTNGGNGELILPLMGRRLMSGRDKWQYYTISNTGNLNTKLPVSLNGKSCTGEYGCDDITNGDNVYVEGYNDTFKVTIYENSLYNYIPYL